MKRIGFVLTEETLSLRLCKQAIYATSKNKTKRRSVQRVLNDIDFYSNDLRNMILDNTYEPSPYKECHIVDKPSKKARILEKPVFYPDQCLHHAMILLLHKRIMARLDHYCICGIKGRGTQAGYNALRKWLDADVKHTKYCLQGDVKKCYESIKPKMVIVAFEKFVKDKRYMAILSKIAYSHSSLPLGNYSSGWFCNLILLAIDSISRRHKSCFYYLRYADDFAALGSNKRGLHDLLLQIKEWSLSFGLRIKGNWQVYRVDVRGIDMLGFRFFRDHTILRKRNSLSFMREIKKYKRNPTQKGAKSILCRAGQLKHVNSFNFKKKYLADLDRKELKEVANNGC